LIALFILIYLEEIIHGLISIFLNQLDHALEETVRFWRVWLNGPTNLGHNRLAVFTLYISEGHLGALVFVEFELREVQVGHLIKWHWWSS
jgi:hypothetical protein